MNNECIYTEEKLLKLLENDNKNDKNETEPIDVNMAMEEMSEMLDKLEMRNIEWNTYTLQHMHENVITF